MSTELERCMARAATAHQALRRALLDLLGSLQINTTHKHIDRYMESLENYVEARMDLREAEIADARADAGDY